MLIYYINSTNEYSIRTEDITLVVSGETHLYIENMDSGVVTDILLDFTFESFEQILKFSLDLTNIVKEGEQFRCIIKYEGVIKWRGSLSIFTNEPINKMDYETKLNSNIIDIENDYIILEN